MLRSDPIFYGFMQKIPRHGWAVMVTRLIRRRPHILIRSRVQVSYLHVLTYLAPVCSATRSALIVGQNAIRFGGHEHRPRGAGQKIQLPNTYQLQHFWRLKATRPSTMARLIITLSGIQMHIIIMLRVKQTSRIW